MRSARSRPTESNVETLIHVDGLRTYYGGEGVLADAPVKAVDGVDFEIRRGETFGLVGESGSGKTTLGRTLLKLEAATEGSIVYDGTDITSLSGSSLTEWRQNAQIVFQDPESSLNDRLTVGAIIREPLEAHDWRTPTARRQRVRELLDAVGLTPAHYTRYPHQFSGGQRQRIAIARALALNPEFLVLDEPVSALDVSVQARIIQLLEELQDEFGLTYLLIAHDLSVVEHICDRVAVMYLGKIMEKGPTEAVFSESANPYTHALLSAVPEPDPTKNPNRLTLRGTPPSPRNPPSGCVFSTRCPAKIYPDISADLSYEQWDVIEQIRAVLRERARDSQSLSERFRRRVGLYQPTAGFDASIDAIRGDVSLPESVTETIESALATARAGYHQQAVRELEETFSGICENEVPATHAQNDETHESRCHRHRDTYTSVQTVINERFNHR